MAKHASSKSAEDTALEKAYGHYCRGEFELVLQVYDKTNIKHRTSNLWLVMAGAAHCRLRHFAAAEPLLRKAIQREPNNADALTWMAVITKGNPDLSVPLGYAERAIKLRPQDPTGHSVLGQVYLSAKDPEKAYDPLKKAATLAKQSAEHWHNFALGAMALKRHDEAIAAYQKAIQCAPTVAQNYLALASTYSLFGFIGDAISTLQAALENCPESASIHTALANNFSLLRNEEDAEYHHSVARSMSVEGELGFGAWLVNQGRFDESVAIFEKAIAEEITPGYCFYNLMLSRKVKSGEHDDQLVASMRKFVDSKPTAWEEMYISYALGRAEDQRGNYAEAAFRYDRANALAFDLNRNAPTGPISRFESEHEVDRKVFEELKGRNPSGNPSDAPIFIVGMIRSGTTLLDQILSSHSAVESGGEMRYWLEESRKLALRLQGQGEDHLPELARDYLTYARLLTGSRARFTDKMPLNYQCMGTVHLALPNAKFVHIRRNPIDTALSIWMTYFGQGPSFAYERARIVANYRAYQRSMAYWRGALPANRLLELDYEDLIARPTDLIPTIIEFLGLPWEDACLHHDKNASAINTPSRWQARQPIYRTSVERWRKYEPWLGEFAQLMDEPH